MTHCQQDPHEAWSSDRHNITQNTVDKTRTKHGRQTDTTIHDTLSTTPAQSMVARQTQQYITHCRQDPHEAWSPDRHNITQHTVDKTRTKHGRQTDTTIHDTLSTRPARSMVARQTQQYMTHCRQHPHKAWSPDRHNKYMTHCRQDLHKAWSPDRHNIDFIKVVTLNNVQTLKIFSKQYPN